VANRCCSSRTALNNCQTSSMFHFLGGQHHGRFEATYRAFPLAFIDKQSAEYGDKVILPPSALDRLGELLLFYSCCMHTLCVCTAADSICCAAGFDTPLLTCVCCGCWCSQPLCISSTPCCSRSPTTTRGAQRTAVCWSLWLRRATCTCHAG
jgi:hypothetical protein